MLKLISALLSCYRSTCRFLQNQYLQKSTKKYKITYWNNIFIFKIIIERQNYILITTNIFRIINIIKYLKILCNYKIVYNYNYILPCDSTNCKHLCTIIGMPLFVNSCSERGSPDTFQNKHTITSPSVCPYKARYLCVSKCWVPRICLTGVVRLKEMCPK